jgi:hypothetical protein
MTASFDPPGSVGTAPSSINDTGAITGRYSDSKNALHGFVRQPDGSITSFDPPGSAGNTAPSSINDMGAITGYYWDSNQHVHGFLRTP